jgi:hypothetical protein
MYKLKCLLLLRSLRPLHLLLYYSYLTKDISTVHLYKRVYYSTASFEAVNVLDVKPRSNH